MSAVGASSRDAKRTPPVSIRLTPDERARLERAAGTMPLGTYIKSVVLADGAPVHRTRLRNPVPEQRTLAQVLARLGASRMASNLNQLAHAANTGSLDCDEEVAAMLAAACADIQSMRVMLITALGLKSAAPTPSAPPSRRAFSLAVQAGGRL